MKKNRLNWRDTIVRMFQDNNGNLLMGTENAITPEDLLKAMKLKCDKNTAEGRELYNRVRVELNAFMSKLCIEGYSAGSYNRMPSMYFIAKNKAERRMLLGKVVKNINGRLRLLQSKGKDLLSPRRIDNVMKELDYFAPEEDQGN